MQPVQFCGVAGTRAPQPRLTFSSVTSQRSQGALTLAVPILTCVLNGVIETLMSPGARDVCSSLVSRLFTAAFRATILPFWPIEPVLSSTSASSIFLVP